METEVFLTPEEYDYLLALARDADMTVEQYLEAMGPDIFRELLPPATLIALVGSNHQPQNHASLWQRIMVWIKYWFPK